MTDAAIFMESGVRHAQTILPAGAVRLSYPAGFFMEVRPMYEQQLKQQLENIIRDTMSPEAVAIIIAHLQPAEGRTDAYKDVDWFRNELVEIVGGHEAVSRLFEEVGL